jgi:hypothetical protein
MKQSFTFLASLKTVNLYGSELRLQYCQRNLRIACKAAQVAIPLGEVKLYEKLKNGDNI